MLWVASCSDSISVNSLHFLAYRAAMNGVVSRCDWPCPCLDLCRLVYCVVVVQGGRVTGKIFHCPPGCVALSQWRGVIFIKLWFEFYAAPATEIWLTGTPAPARLHSRLLSLARMRFPHGSYYVNFNFYRISNDILRHETRWGQKKVILMKCQPDQLWLARDANN